MQSLLGGLAVLGLVVVFAQGVMCLVLKRKSQQQKKTIKRQERVIHTLEDHLKNAKVKQKHQQEAQFLSDDDLPMRMQHKDYYRD